jgi:nicotinamide phosphoribosyltransferase
MLDNIILQTDSYKVSHYGQYPPNTEVITSYFESRGFKENIGDTKSIRFFGLQYIIKKYLTGKVLTKEKIEQAKKVFDNHLGEGLFNYEGWCNLLEDHGGYLPIEINAVPEGGIYNPREVLITVKNTDEKYYWLTNYLETLLVQVWYPTTVSTLSYLSRVMIQKHLDLTSDDTSVDFKLHDFGYRGVSSSESAAIGGAAHLLNFKGTDTVASLEMIHDYYGGSYNEGFSIPASEHSTITSWGENNEMQAYLNMLKTYPKGLVACVSDSYDIYNACSDIWGDKLRDLVINRDGTLVIRPDSGEPCEVILSILDILGDKFGYKTNSKGYKVLNEKVRIIQGDGVDYWVMDEILEEMAETKWAAENITFGMGGSLLQKLNRDTLSFAFKCCSIKQSGETRPVYKNPVTDTSKMSKRIMNDPNDLYPKLRPVFRDGKLLIDESFEEIRGRK